MAIDQQGKNPFPVKICFFQESIIDSYTISVFIQIEVLMKYLIVISTLFLAHVTNASEAKRNVENLALQLFHQGLAIDNTLKRLPQETVKNDVSVQKMLTDWKGKIATIDMTHKLSTHTATSQALLHLIEEGKNLQCGLDCRLKSHMMKKLTQ